MIALRFGAALLGGTSLSLAVFMLAVYLREGMPPQFLADAGAFLASPAFWDVAGQFALLCAFALALARLSVWRIDRTWLRGAIAGLGAGLSYGLWVFAGSLLPRAAVQPSWQRAAPELGLLAAALMMGSAFAHWLSERSSSR